MKLTLLTENRLRLEPEPGAPRFEAGGEAAAPSPFQLVAAGLAICTYSLLQAWAAGADLSTNELAVEIEWELGDQPRRVVRYSTELFWPSLPADRDAAAARTVALCPLHRTLEVAPELQTVVHRRPADAPVGNAPTR